MFMDSVFHPPKFLLVRLPEALRDAIFLDVELDGNDAIAPVHGVVQVVDASTTGAGPS